MSGPRVVLVTRRFWPQAGAAPAIFANLAGELRRLGARPLILTAQLEKSWPREFVYRETPVVRLPHPPARFWGALRYLRSVAGWLRSHRNELDAACVSSLGYDAYMVLGALRDSSIPVVLRAERSGPDGDCQWQQSATFGSRVRRRCLAADAIIAPNRAVGSELVAAGYPQDRVHLIANGTPTLAFGDATRKLAARASLAEAHPILGLEKGAPLVICVGRISAGKGLVDLVDAWPAIMRRRPQARLWLIGQGPHAEKVWTRIQHHELASDVILTGLFDDLEDVLLAADLFVHPRTVAGISLALVEAMAAGLPIVATDLPAIRELVTANEHAILVPPNNSAALSAAIEQLLDDRRMAHTLALAARERATSQFSLSRMAAEHLALFERVKDEG